MRCNEGMKEYKVQQRENYVVFVALVSHRLYRMRLAYELRKLLLTIIFIIMLSPSLFAESGTVEMGEGCDFIGYNPEINMLFFWCGTVPGESCGTDYELRAVDPWTFEEEFMIAMPGFPGLILTTANGEELIFTVTNFETTKIDFGSRAKLIKVESATGVILREVDYGFGSMAISMFETKDKAYIVGSKNTSLIKGIVEDIIRPSNQPDVWAIDKADMSKSTKVDMDYLQFIIESAVSSDKIYFSGFYDFYAQEEMINLSNPGILYIYDESKTSVFNLENFKAKRWKRELEDSLVKRIRFDSPIHRIIAGNDNKVYLFIINIDEKRSQVFALDPKTDTITKIFSQENVLLIDPVYDETNNRFFALSAFLEESDPPETVYRNEIIQINLKNNSSKNLSLHFEIEKQMDYELTLVTNGRKSRIFISVNDFEDYESNSLVYYMDIG